MERSVCCWWPPVQCVSVIRVLVIFCRILTWLFAVLDLCWITFIDFERKTKWAISFAVFSPLVTFRNVKKASRNEEGKITSVLVPQTPRRLQYSIRHNAYQLSPGFRLTVSRLLKASFKASSPTLSPPSVHRNSSPPTPMMILWGYFYCSAWEEHFITAN